MGNPWDADKAAGDTPWAADKPVGGVAAGAVDKAVEASAPYAKAFGRGMGLNLRGAAPPLVGAGIGAAVGAPAGPPGMAAGALVGGVALPIADLLTYAYNLGAKRLGANQVQLPSQYANDLMSKMGLPEPENTAERMQVAGGAALGGLAGQIPAAANLATTAASPVTRGVMETIAKEPAAQALVAAPAAAGAQFAYEKTDSPLAGLATGIGVGLVGGGGAKLTGIGARERIPTRPELRAQAAAQYKAASDAGVVISGGSLSSAVNDIASLLGKEGFDAKLHPRVATALDRLAEDANRAGGAISLDEMETLRRVSQAAASSADPSEKRLASMLVERLDDFMDTIGPDDLVAGDAKEGVAALKQARELWNRNRKAEIIETVIERAKNAEAQYSNSGMDNALRVQFRNLANDPKRFKKFTPEERTAILKVVRGAPAQNVLRFFGKFAPTGPVPLIPIVNSAGIGAAAGGYLAGPVGAVIGGSVAPIAATAATAARARAKAMTLSNAKSVDEQVRLGRIPATEFVPALPLRGALAGLNDDQERNPYPWIGFPGSILPQQ